MAILGVVYSVCPRNECGWPPSEGPCICALPSAASNGATGDQKELPDVSHRTYIHLLYRPALPIHPTRSTTAQTPTTVSLHPPHRSRSLADQPPDRRRCARSPCSYSPRPRCSPQTQPRPRLSPPASVSASPATRAGPPASTETAVRRARQYALQMFVGDGGPGTSWRTVSCREDGGGGGGERVGGRGEERRTSAG